MTVGNFEKNCSNQICESFLKQFDGVVMVKPEVKNNRKEAMDVEDCLMVLMR